MIALAVAAVVLSACRLSVRAPAAGDVCGIEQVLDDWSANETLRSCAVRGDPRAQAFLGMIYWSASGSQALDNEGRGVDGALSREQMRVEGRQWLESAAALGNREAQNELGLAHLEGLYGVPLDAGRAFAMFASADALGDPIASYNLARMHYAGLGVPWSEWRAELLLWRSASRGYQPAFCTLALLSERRGAPAKAAMLKIAARALEEGFYRCSFDSSDVSDEFK